MRRYYFPSVTHGGSYVGGFSLIGDQLSPARRRARSPGTPNPSAEIRRVVLKARTDWVSTNKAPPASRYPTLRAGDLVPASAAAIG